MLTGIDLGVVTGWLGHTEQAVDLRKLRRQGAAIAQNLDEEPGVRLSQSAVELGKNTLGDEGRQFSRGHHPPHKPLRFLGHGKSEPCGKARHPQDPDRIFGKRVAHMAQEPGPEIRKAPVGVDELPSLRTSHGINSEIPTPQVLNQGDPGVGVYHEPAVARGGLALGPRQGVFAVRLGVQKYREIRTYAPEAAGFHLLRGRADHDIIPISNRPAEQFIPHCAAYEIGFHMPREVLSQDRHCIRFLLILLLTMASLSGCALPYYAQAVGGQLAIMNRERPIAEILTKPSAPVALKHRLRYVLRLRRFAEQKLDLPLHGNYRDYVSLHRPYVVWNVFAARPLSLTLKRWCFPIAGCVAYRGYFAQTRAYRYAAHLKKRGYDVFVGGVPAYATLGYLHDPVLSSFLDESRPRIAHTIFHELAHDLLYVQNATTFDESFADTVAAVGVKRFLKDEGTPAEREDYARQDRRRKAVMALVRQCHRRLQQLYARTGLSRTEKLQEKQVIIRQLKAGFTRLAGRWHGTHGFAAFFHLPFNNAVLGAYASYQQLVPAFRRLLALENGNLEAFYRVVRWYGRLPAPLRDRELRSRRDLVSRLSAFQQTKGRESVKLRRPADVGAYGTGLTGPVEHGAHDES